MIDRVIAHYRVVEKLGAGGMGEVYLAEDLTLGRRVALKILPPEHTRDEDRLRRFKQEAKAASALNHPNIITIHEVGESEGQHFITTEFIDGETLRTMLQRPGRLSIGETLRIATQIASALGAAHEAGIVHRDLKPENVMLRRDGYAKVLDFGLAKLVEPASLQGPASSDARSHPVSTRSGVVLGTTQYMSPEQATGQKVDARSDIFAFGACLYEMVTGHCAFEGDSPMATIGAILTQEPKPLPNEVPAELARIVVRCLRKDPARRYQTMADVKVELEEVRAELERPRSAVVSRPRRQWVRVAAALVLLTAATVGLFAWNAGRASEDAPPPTAVALTTLPGAEHAPSLSPDGTYVVFTWTGPTQNNQDVYVQMIGSGSPLRLTTDPRNDYNPVWSPDGRSIAFLRSDPTAPTGRRSREVLLIPPLGGAERTLTEIQSHDFFPIALYLSWSADSKTLVVTDSPGAGKPDALFAVSIETGEKTQLTHPQPPVLADISPAISPDGRSLVFLRRTSWGSGELHLLPLGQQLTAAGAERRLTNAEQRADYPTWTPDGREIVFAARGSLWRLAVDGDNAATRIPFVGEDALTPTISRPQSGRPARLVYVRSFVDGNFWRIATSAPGAPTSSAPVATISSTRHEYHIRFSPDGRRVAFTSSRSGDSEIWVSDPDGANAIKLTSMGAQETMCPSWSRDGRTILFSSNPEGEFDLYTVPALGGKPRRVTSHPAIDICGSFSTDGQWIYFASMRSGDYRIWRMRATGGAAEQITSDPGGAAVVSADGRSVYYHPPSIVAPVWRVPAAGGEPVKVLDGMIWFNFAPLEKGAYYIDQAEGATRLRFLDFSTGRTTTVASDLGRVSSGLAASPDGKTILFTRIDSFTDDLMLVESFR